MYYVHMYIHGVEYDTRNSTLPLAPTCDEWPRTHRTTRASACTCDACVVRARVRVCARVRVVCVWHARAAHARRTDTRSHVRVHMGVPARARSVGRLTTRRAAGACASSRRARTRGRPRPRSSTAARARSRGAGRSTPTPRPDSCVSSAGSACTWSAVVHPRQLQSCPVTGSDGAF